MRVEYLKKCSELKRDFGRRFITFESRIGSNDTSSSAMTKFCRRLGRKKTRGRGHQDQLCQMMNIKSNRIQIINFVKIKGIKHSTFQRKANIEYYNKH